MSALLAMAKDVGVDLALIAAAVHANQRRRAS
jgi:UDP-glucose 6-dehydrogenase